MTMRESYNFGVDTKAKQLYTETTNQSETMVEKRFTIDKDGITIIDNCTDGLTECKYSNEAYLLCNFLNEQHEALIELKEIGDYQADRIKELTEENTKLEEQLRNLRRLANELYMEGSE